MESYWLVGKGIEDHGQQLSGAFAQNNYALKIYGDEKNYIDCENLNFPGYSQVLIHTHGNKYDEVHTIGLCKEGEVTEQSLKAIAKNKAVNFELFSCYAGTAINSKTSLSKWSTLITSTSPDHEALSAIIIGVITKLINIEHNSFIRFAAYIFINPDSVKFAVQSEGKYAHIYSTDDSFKKITDFSDSNLIAWQNDQLNNFLQFVKKIQPKMNGQRSKEIDECVSLFQDDKRKSEFLEPFDIKHYKALILINESNRGNIDKVSLLIDKGVLLNEKSNNGFTALLSAAHNGHEKIVKLLVNKGALLNERTNNSFTALHLAAQNGYEKIAKLLVNKGALLNERTDNGLTALHSAVQSGYEKIAKLLVNKGASINEKFEDGSTSLHIAAMQNYTKIVNLLVDSGALLNERNNNGFTALHLASGKGYSKIVELLVDKGALPNEKNNVGYTALQTTAYLGYDKVVKLLLDSGASLNEKTNAGLTALHLASEKDHDKVVKLLVDKGALLNEKNNVGTTSLQTAAYFGHEKVVKLLVDSGASLNEKINAGFTALQLAMQENKTEVIKELLAAGASVNNNLMVYRHNEITKFKADPVKYIL
ncbi:MAG: ankyrin repeat domain-containing protein, partial [Rickettsiales bacterium]